MYSALVHHRAVAELVLPLLPFATLKLLAVVWSFIAAGHWRITYVIPGGIKKVMGRWNVTVTRSHPVAATAAVIAFVSEVYQAAVFLTTCVMFRLACGLVLLKLNAFLVMLQEAGGFVEDDEPTDLERESMLPFPRAAATRYSHSGAPRCGSSPSKLVHKGGRDASSLHSDEDASGVSPALATANDISEGENDGTDAFWTLRDMGGERDKDDDERGFALAGQSLIAEHEHLHSMLREIGHRFRLFLVLTSVLTFVETSVVRPPSPSSPTDVVQSRLRFTRLLLK